MMKRSWSTMVIGLVLVLMGGLFLLQNIGWLPEIGLQIWSGIFLGAGLVFLIMFLVTGMRQWGWLFPASIMAGLAAVILITETRFGGARSGELAGATFMASVSLPFWLVFLFDMQKNRWALIPGWVTAVLTGIILMANQVQGEILGAAVLLSVALPFLVVYLLDKQRTWALIPAGILFALGLISFLAGVFEIANLDERFIAAMSYLVLALPFVVLWTMRDRLRSDWAKYPAVGLLVLSLLSLFLGDRMGIVWAVMLMLVGGWLLLSAMRPKLKG